MESTCVACGNAILDRYIMQVDGNIWHQSCLKCSDCFCDLAERCYVKHGQVFCVNDYVRRFGQKCYGCDKTINPTDFVHKSKYNDVTSVYHVSCFACSVCARELSPGCEYMHTAEGQLVCPDDYVTMTSNEDSDDEHNEISSSEAQTDLCEMPKTDDVKTENEKDIKNEFDWFNSGSMDDVSNSIDYGLPGYGNDDALSNHDSAVDQNENPESIRDKSEMKLSPTATSCVTLPSTKRRGPRTTIKAKQLDTLKAAFAVTPKPTRHIREQLAQDTGLTMRVIQVWFQNRRSKERRMKQMNVLGSRRHFFENNLPRRIREQDQPANAYFNDIRHQSPYYPNPSYDAAQINPHFSPDCFAPAWTPRGDHTPTLEQHNDGIANAIVTSQYPATGLDGSPKQAFIGQCYSGIQQAANETNSRFDAIFADGKRESAYWHQS